MARFELTAAAAGSRLPWRSNDSLSVATKGSPVVVKQYEDDEQWQIDACLRCPYPECHNCFDAWKTAFANIRYDTHKNRKKRKKVGSSARL